MRRFRLFHFPELGGLSSGTDASLRGTNGRGLRTIGGPTYARTVMELAYQRTRSADGFPYG
jgi:hypothetical protein